MLLTPGQLVKKSMSMRNTENMCKINILLGTIVKVCVRVSPDFVPMSILHFICYLLQYSYQYVCTQEFRFPGTLLVPVTFQHLPHLQDHKSHPPQQLLPLHRIWPHKSYWQVHGQCGRLQATAIIVDASLAPVAIFALALIVISTVISSDEEVETATVVLFDSDR